MSTTETKNALSILICTARRPGYLRDLLIAIKHAYALDRVFELEVIIIDNDLLRSAKVVADEFTQQFGAELRYVHEPTPGVSSARNTALERATHNFCLFLDDDQIIGEKFFSELFKAITATPKNFSAIRLHVSWQFEALIPQWMQRGLSGDTGRNNHNERHGKPLLRTEMGTGGLLLNKEQILERGGDGEPLFDLALNKTGGEDVAMFLKANDAGKSFYYAACPAVTERVPANRATVRYGLMSARRKGFVDATLALRETDLRQRLSYAATVFLHVAAASTLLPLSVLGGRLKAFNAVMMLWRQFGKCMGLFRGDLKHYGQIKAPVVLHLTGGGHDGGAEKIIEQISVHTSGTSADLRFFFYDSSGPRPFSNVISKRWDKIVHHKKSNGIDWRLWLRLSLFVRREKVAVIHTHDIGAMLHANVARLFNPSVRLVHTEHTLHYWIERKKYRRLYRALSLGYDNIACVSAYVKNEINRKVGVATKKLKVVPNGVDTEAFKPRSEDAQSHSSERLFRLISVSRIDDNKNVAQILRALAMVRARGLSATLTHVGSGQKEDIEKITALTDELGLKDVVTFAGFQSQVAPWLESSDCFISASKVECHPVSVLEAMASGKPCILSGIAPHQEVQRAASNPGIILFDEQDGALADAIENMYANFNDHKKSAYELIKSTRESYSIPVMLTRYSTLYAGI